MALTDLRSAEVRARALADLPRYLDGYELSADERQSVLDHDWVKMWRLGASPYTMNKLRHIDRLEHDQLGPLWRGVSAEKLEEFLDTQNARNAVYTLPVDES